MSGYLTNLLRRTFEPSAAVVQPRPNALFAPPEKSSAWGAPHLTTAEPGSVEETTSPDGSTPAPRTPLPQPSAPETSSRSRQADSSLIPASTNRSLSRDTSLGQVATEHEEHADASLRMAARGAEVSQQKPNEALRSVAAPQTDAVSKLSAPVIAAKGWPKKSGKAGLKPSMHQRQEQSLSSGNAEIPMHGMSAPLTDQRSTLSGKPSGLRVQAAASLDRLLAPEPGPPAQQVRDVVAPAFGDPERLTPKADARKVVRAFPPPAVENRKGTRSIESSFAESKIAEAKIAATKTFGSKLDESMFGRAPLSIRPSDLRPWGRPEPERAEPTIEVTIGRIEVRGELPSAPRRTSSRPAGEASLEQYLRRRSGRGANE